jgi:hypothetical protein
MRAHTSKDRIDQLMRQMGAAVKSEGRIYFTGGVTAVMMGWRETTIDVDLKAEPEPLGFFECLPRLKDDLDINIELAAPDLFVPALPGWQNRSRFIAQHGKLGFYHYDFYGQALSKLERGHPRDRHDVECMRRDGLVAGERLRELFESIEDQLIRYPAIHAEQLRATVMDFCAESV